MDIPFGNGSHREKCYCSLPKEYELGRVDSRSNPQLAKYHLL